MLFFFIKYYQSRVPSVGVVSSKVIVQRGPDVVFEDEWFTSGVVQDLGHGIAEDPVHEVAGFARHEDVLKIKRESCFELMSKF